VGTFFVNCCLQTGQGLVIAYVIALFSLRAGTACPRTTVHVACQKSCLFAGRFCPRLPGARRGRCTFAQARPRATSSAPVRYSFIELRNKSREMVRPFCRIRREPYLDARRAYLFCSQLSTIESCRDTAVAVAQIFPVVSRKFPMWAKSRSHPNYAD
jgi:hypothetical protein